MAMQLWINGCSINNKEHSSYEFLPDWYPWINWGHNPYGLPSVEKSQELKSPIAILALFKAPGLGEFSLAAFISVIRAEKRSKEVHIVLICSGWVMHSKGRWHYGPKLWKFWYFPIILSGYISFNEYLTKEFNERNHIEISVFYQTL